MVRRDFVLPESVNYVFFSFYEFIIHHLFGNGDFFFEIDENGV